MGEAFRGRDIRLDPTVAAKVLASHLATEADLRHCFEREACCVGMNGPALLTKRWRRVGLPLACVLVMLTVTRAEAQSSTPAIIDLATAYAHRFVEAFSNVVAEERYVQEATWPRQRRTLRSDFLLVRYPGATEWLAFRDVLEVDGKPVQDEPHDRLARLFLEPPPNASRRIDEIARASARHNLRDIGTLNNPLRVHAILQRHYRDRFRFTVARLERSLGPTVRTVRFDEFVKPTLVRDSENRDLLSHGFVWIDEQTGRVVKTELRIAQSAAPSRPGSPIGPQGKSLPISITTLFRFDEELGVDVPVEMRDWYPTGAADMRGVATYGRFRRFRVQADTELHK
jgi:hypothetical protein